MAEVIVIGAGMAGTMAAHTLRAAGHDVAVVDKGLAVGGRMAARTVEGATFDVGAQFLTAKSETFRHLTAGWAAAGLLRTWFHGSPDRDAPAEPDGHPRLHGVPTMRSLVEHLAGGLDVRLGWVVGAVTPRAQRLLVHLARRPTDGGGGRGGPRPEGAATTTLEADAVLATMPVPQVRAVLDAGGASLGSAAEHRLAAATYDPCLTILAVPDGPTTLPARGAVRVPDGDITWISDNRVSGASALPALTIHAGAQLSRARYTAPTSMIADELLTLAAPLIGTSARPVHLHRWRYATPTAALGPEPMVERLGGCPFAVAGDAFAGGRVEGAAMSGLATAEALCGMLADDA